MLSKIEISKGFNKILQLSDNASELSLLSHSSHPPEVSNIIFILLVDILRQAKPHVFSVHALYAYKLAAAVALQD